MIEKLLDRDDLKVNGDVFEMHHRKTNNLCAYRTMKGLSLEEVAFILNVPVYRVHNWEIGRKIPSELEQDMLCDLYNVSRDRLGLVQKRQHKPDICPVDVMRTLKNLNDVIDQINASIVDERLVDLISKVIFHNPETIVLWKDGTKTVVRAQGERFDKEKGVLMALNKYLFGKHYGRDLEKVIEEAVDSKPRNKSKSAKSNNKSGGKKR